MTQIVNRKIRIGSYVKYTLRGDVAIFKVIDITELCPYCSGIPLSKVYHLQSPNNSKDKQVVHNTDNRIVNVKRDLIVLTDDEAFVELL